MNSLDFICQLSLLKGPLTYRREYVFLAGYKPCGSRGGSQESVFFRPLFFACFSLPMFFSLMCFSPGLFARCFCRPCVFCPFCFARCFFARLFSPGPFFARCSFAQCVFWCFFRPVLCSPAFVSPFYCTVCLSPSSFFADLVMRKNANKDLTRTEHGNPKP